MSYYMALRKKNSLLNMANSYVLDSPQPSNLNYFWNFGSLLALCLVIQLATGITLTMHYSSHASLAFDSVEHIMRECAFVPYVESDMSISPIILGSLIWIIAFKYYDYSESNKPMIWIAVSEWIRKIRPYWLIANFKGICNGYVEKLETLKWNNNSRVVLNGICQLLYCKVMEYISRFYNILNTIHYFELEVELNNSIAQGPKAKQTINTDDMELREGIASSIYYTKRPQSPHTSDDLINSEGAKEDSELWTSLKPSNDQQGKPKGNPRKPVRKTKPDLFVEVSRRLKKFQSKDNKYYNINELLGDPYFLIACYENIKSKPGNMTKGINNYTLDGINGKWFIDNAKKLKDGTYKFTPARLVDIPKANGKTRTLSITTSAPNPYIMDKGAGDKIIHKAVAIILEAIYEPIFKNSSYGYRRNKGTHDALQVIKLQGAGHSWVIQGDISKCFDSIPHDIIRKELNKTIACPNMKALINKIIGYPYKDKDDNIIKSKIGTPQGTICSPILSNIVLHKLDSYMEDYKKKFDKGKLKRHNPEYIKLQYLRKKAIEAGDRKLSIQLLMQMRSITAFNSMYKNFKRMLYIRYSDDFIVYLTCTYVECVEIKENIRKQLLNKCGLRLNLDKTQITNTKKHFKFLGADIVNNPTKDYVVYDKGLNTWKKAHLRSLVKAPIKDIIEKLKDTGLVKMNSLGQVFPKGRTNLFTASHYDIIKWYNSKINGIFNYYSFASNYPKLGTIIWYLRASCALTLANKYKLKSMRKAFQKFGTFLKDPETDIQIITKDNYKVQNKFNSGNSLSHTNLDEKINASWATKLTETNFGKECCVCGSKSDIEMHHVRKIANIRASLLYNGYKSNKIISAMSRKQVPLCKYHHIELEGGKLGDREFKKVIEYNK